MAKEKQHVFSARTTEEGLTLLNKLKEEKGIGWDDLVIDAVCAHYGLDTLVMSLPKAYRPEKPKEEKKAVAKGKKGGGGAKARKVKATKEKKPAAETAQETQLQQE